MKKKRNRKSMYIKLLIYIFVLATILAISFQQRSQRSFVVTLTKKGFSPQKLTIHKDDTVTFKTTRNKAFWPASDLHPTHEIYSEFDPKEPTDTKKTWSFTFTKEGEWKFHDHLAPYYRGVIIVKSKVKNNSTAISCKFNKTLCWQQMIKKTLATGGLEQAFNLIGKLYETEPAFNEECHTFTHLLGEEAFELYALKKRFSMNFRMGSFCGFGFYHGFITSFYSKTRDLNQAKGFCEFIKNSNPIKYHGTDFPCYHGLGHGFLEEVPDKKLWGNPHKIVNHPLELCEKLTDDKEKVYICATGVFNSLAILIDKEEYGLGSLAKDPYAICTPSFYNSIQKRACYSQMNSLVIPATGNSLASAIRYAQSIRDSEYIGEAVDSAATHYAWKKQEINLFPEILHDCHTAEKEDTRLSCIVGYAYGLIAMSPPNKEYEKPVKFCAQNGFTYDEKRTCFTKIAHYFRSLYPQKVIEKICSDVDPEYRKFCLAK